MPDEEMHEAQPEPKADDGIPEFRNPFEGHLDPEVFPGAPSDKSILTEYESHIARCIYENVVSCLIL
jgi:hypothetical protein